MNIRLIGLSLSRLAHRGSLFGGGSAMGTPLWRWGAFVFEHLHTFALSALYICVLSTSIP